MELNEKRRRDVFYSVDIILMLTAFFFLPYNVLFGDVLLGLLEGIAGVILLVIHILVQYKRISLRRASWILVTFVIGFVFVAINFMELSLIYVAWVVIPYFLAMFLLGLKNGIYIGTFYFVAIMAAIVFHYGSGDNALPTIDIINVGIANVFAFLFSAHYEKARAENEAELLRINREIEILSNHDGLTGLYNRRYFDMVSNREFHRSKREREPLAVLIGDIDYFKNYNDTCGHLQGDSCLSIVADVIRSSITRATDTAARYGGEEFAVLLPNTDMKGALVVAERIRSKMTEEAIPHPLSSVSDLVTLSLGISVVSAEDVVPSDVLRRADKALYISKSNGRDKVAVL